MKKDYQLTESKLNKLTEEKVDKEIFQRTGTMHVYHIQDVTTTKINGITVVSHIRFTYRGIINIILDGIEAHSKHNLVLPSDLKQYIKNQLDCGVAICDYRDQYNRIKGRTEAKRDWLRTHPRSKL